MLHRTRHLFIRQQTALINSIRAHLAEFGIVAPVAPQPGAVITKVESGSPAARAGLRPGDVVVRLGDRTVVGSAFLRNRMAFLRIGEVAELSVLRDGKPLTVRATVAARDQRLRPK